MRTFFILIFISFKLFAFPIGNGKAMFSSDTKGTIVKKFHNSTVNLSSFDEELNETEESEHDSTHLISENPNFYLKSLFASLLKKKYCLNWGYSSLPYYSQQLYRLYDNFRI